MALTPNPSAQYEPTTPGDVAHQADHDEINPMLQPVLDAPSGSMFRRVAGGILEAFATTSVGRALLNQPTTVALQNTLDVDSRAQVTFKANAARDAAIASAKTYTDAEVQAAVKAGAVNPRGVWDDSIAYDTLDLVYHAGNSWYANEPTVPGDEPGVAATWTSYAAGLDEATANAAFAPAFVVDAALGDGVTDATAHIQSRVTAAGVNGTVLFPRGVYRTTAIIEPLEGQTLRGSDRDTSIIEYDGTWGTPAIDVLEDDVTVEDLTVRSTVAVGDMGPVAEHQMSPSRFMGPNGMATAVYTAAHRARLSRLTVERWLNGVHLDSWNLDGAGGTTTFAQGCTVEDILVVDCRMGVIFRGQNNIRVSNIRGNYFDVTDTPPHLVYATGLTSQANVSTNVVIDGVQAWDSPDSSACKIHAVGGSATGLHANGCGGVLAVFDSSDLTITDVSSVNDLSSTTPALLVNNSDLVVVSDILLLMGGNGGRPIAVDAGASDTGFRDVEIHCDASTVDALRLRGTDNSAHGLTVVGGGNANTVAVRFDAGTGHVVDGLRTRGVGLIAAGAAPGLLVYDSVLQSGMLQARPVVKTHADFRVNNVGGIREIATGSSGAVNIRMGITESVVIRSQHAGGNALTPSDQAIGQRLTVIIWNDTAGSISPSFGAAFTLTGGSWANPSAGNRRAISFIHDGNTFVETSRSAA